MTMSSTPPSSLDAPSSAPLVADLSRESVAALNRALTRDEIHAVLNQVPFYVIADDDEMIRWVSLSAIESSSDNPGSIVSFEGDNMEHCFDEAFSLEQGKQPVIMCRNGEQANEASSIVCSNGIQSGVLVYDQMMGVGPRGQELFRSFHGKFPPGIARILNTGTPPDDLYSDLDAGVLDDTLLKPVDFDTFKSVIARSYLKRVCGDIDAN